MSDALDLMVDIDEVLVDTMGAIHQIAFERGLHDNSSPVTAWRGWELYGCSPEDYWACWDHHAETGGYVTIEPNHEAVQALRELYLDGHRIHLVTARGFLKRGPEVKVWTREWAERFAIPMTSLTFAQDKVAAQETLGLAFDWAIDDSPTNYIALKEADVNVRLQLHHHNRQFVLDENPQVTTGVADWADEIRASL